MQFLLTHQILQYLSINSVFELQVSTLNLWLHLSSNVHKSFVWFTLHSTSLTYIYPLIVSRCHLSIITFQDGVPIFYMAPMEGKETPTNINMGLYRKWASSFLECPKEQQTIGLKIVQNCYLLENYLELICKTIMFKTFVELQNNYILAIIELCDFVEQFCS